MDVRHYGWRIHTNNHRTAAFYVTSQCTSRMFSCWPSLYPPHRNNLRQARNRSVVRNRVISKAIKKANSMGFMSVTHKDPHFMKDPNIFDIRHLE